MRKYYIDNLRWLCIVLLLPFHAAMAWNSWGEGNYIYYEPNQALSTFLIMIAQWYMPLLFVLAGMSARYALQKRSYRAFVLERVEKLMVELKQDRAGNPEAALLVALYRKALRNAREARK